MKGFPAGCLEHLVSIKSLHYHSLYLHGLLTKLTFSILLLSFPSLQCYNKNNMAFGVTMLAYGIT